VEKKPSRVKLRAIGLGLESMATRRQRVEKKMAAGEVVDAKVPSVELDGGIIQTRFKQPERVLQAVNGFVALATASICFALVRDGLPPLGALIVGVFVAG